MLDERVKMLMEKDKDLMRAREVIIKYRAAKAITKEPKRGLRKKPFVAEGDGVEGD